MRRLLLNNIRQQAFGCCYIPLSQTNPRQVILSDVVMQVMDCRSYAPGLILTHARKGTSDGVVKCRLFSQACYFAVHRLGLLNLAQLNTFTLANFVVERYERFLTVYFGFVLLEYSPYFLLFLNISRCLDMSDGYPKLMPSTKCHFILQNRYNKFVSNEINLYFTQCVVCYFSQRTTGEVACYRDLQTRALSQRQQKF